MRTYLKSIVFFFVVISLALKGENIVKRIDVIESMPEIPENLKIIDWREKAQKYDEFIYNWESQGKYQPLIWEDTKNNTYGLRTFVGDNRKIDGAQEGINILASILGSTLVDIDKSNQKGKNYVKLAQRFYNKKDNAFNNIIDKEIGETFWYELFPNVLYWSISYYYPEVENSDELLKKSADTWYKVAEELGKKEKNFDYTSFDLKKGKGIVKNWIEPDAAVGIAFIQYMAYHKYKDKKYLDAAVWCMDLVNSKKDNPYYEILGSYAPYLAARMNAEIGTKYDVEKMMNWIFNGDSIARKSWGVATGKWGSFEVNGLMGSLTDNGGYMFMMNTAANMAALVPVVSYDLSYANTIGKYVLNTANNAKLFYKDGISIENQGENLFPEDVDSVIPYEGLRYEEHGKTPYATGDAVKYGWGKTDYSLYSGSYIGFLAGIVEKTNVEGILKIDLNKTDYYSKNEYKQYLLYNPYSIDKIVTITVDDFEKNIYENISKKIVASKVKNNFKIKVMAKSSVVLTEVPVTEKIEIRKNSSYIKDLKISSSKEDVINILNLKSGTRISGDYFINVEKNSSKNNIEFKIDNKNEKLILEETGYKLESKKYKNGFHIIEVILKDKENNIVDSSFRKIMVLNKK